MAAKKILFLIDNSVSSLITLSFAAKYFKHDDVNLTFVTPFSNIEIKKPKHPSELLRFLIPNAVSSGVLSSIQLNELANAFQDSRARVISFDVEHTDCAEDLRVYLKFTDLIVAHPDAFDFWCVNDIEKSCKYGPLKITLSGNIDRSINRIVVLNDGSDYSVKAIKDFCRLLNDTFIGVELNLLSTNPGYKSHEQVFLVRFLQAHFHNLAFHVLADEEPRKLRRYLGIDHNTLILNTENANTRFVEKYFIRDNVATLSNIN